MNHSLYVHIPFCKHRCHYCDFNTYAGKESSIPGYVDALIQEIRIVDIYLPKKPVHSIYFGGGTPSLISVAQYEKLIEAIDQGFTLTHDVEISIEVNPGTLTLSYLDGLRKVGFNRISIGVQSTNPLDLTRLDRIHDINDILEGVKFARQVGFGNINLDLIFNQPWQDLPSWKNSLSRSIDLAPEHFSVYALIIEPGTALNDWYNRGLITPQDQDLEAEMYERTMEMLDRAGYVHYEISNWAKLSTDRDFRCRHNLQYWYNLPYVGIGAGAHGYLGHIRTENESQIEDYISRMGHGGLDTLSFPKTPATILTSEIALATQMKDFMWLGLRLVNEGVSQDRFLKTYGYSMREVFDREISALLDLGLVRWSEEQGGNLVLSKRGVMLANQVFMQFVD
jgi:oxygen-independent coproporphyrinogen III oxidase